MWVNNFDSDSLADLQQDLSLESSTQKQSPDQYLDTTKKQVQQQNQDENISVEQKQILDTYVDWINKATQDFNRQKHQHIINSKTIRKIDIKYNNDDNFLSWKWGSGNGYGNDNWLTGWVEIDAQWQNSSWNIYELQTNSEVYTDNPNQRRWEYHELKVWKVTKKENNQFSYWVIWATTHWDIWNRVQSAIHEQLGFTDRSEYSYDSERWNWFWAYIENRKIEQILWTNTNGIQWYFWVWGQIMTEYWRTELHWKVGLNWKKNFHSWFHLKWDISANLQYNFKDPRGETIRNSFDWKDATWIDSEIAIWRKILWWDLDLYAIRSYFNKNRDPDKQEKNTYAVWMKWVKDF